MYTCMGKKVCVPVLKHVNGVKVNEKKNPEEQTITTKCLDYPYMN